MRKWIVIGVLSLLLLAAALRFVFYGDFGLGMGRPEHRVSALEIYEIYRQDQESGNKKYLNKVMEVEGVIAQLDTDENGSTVVMFRKEGAPGGVLCTMDGAVEGLEVGQKVRIKGICTGFLFDVVLNKCVVTG